MFAWKKQLDERDTQFCEPLVDHKELHVWNHWVGPFERCSRQSCDLFLVVEGNKLNFVLWTLSGFLSVFEFRLIGDQLFHLGQVIMFIYNHNAISFIRFRDDDRVIFAKIFEGFPFFFAEYMFLLREVI